MNRNCANCGKSIETDCTDEQCPFFYCSEECADSCVLFNCFCFMDDILKKENE